MKVFIIICAVLIVSVHLVENKNLKPIPRRTPLGHSSRAAGIGRIFNGNDVKPGEVPYYVRVQTAGSICGGSLIHAEWVLTAAHCVEGAVGGSVTLYFGATTWSDHTQTRKNSQAISHPGYRSGTLEYDIALLKLEYPVNLKDDRVDIVKLPAGDYLYELEDARVTGFGMIGDRVPNVLQTGVVNIVPNGPHSMWILGVNLKDKTQICAGDSGGPLVAESTREQIGIVSWLSASCERPSPGGYTRVSFFRDWILDNIGNDQQKIRGKGK